MVAGGVTPCALKKAVQSKFGEIWLARARLISPESSGLASPAAGVASASFVSKASTFCAAAPAASADMPVSMNERVTDATNASRVGLASAFRYSSRDFRLKAIATTFRTLTVGSILPANGRMRNKAARPSPTGPFR